MFDDSIFGLYFKLIENLFCDVLPRTICGKNKTVLSRIMSVSYTHLDVYKRQTSIYDGNGNVVAKYEYDVWGNVLTVSNASNQEIKMCIRDSDIIRLC